MIRIAIDLPKQFRNRLQMAVDLDARFREVGYTIGFGLPDPDLRIIHQDIGVAELSQSDNGRLHTPVIVYERVDSAVITNGASVRNLLAHPDVKFWLKRNTFRDYTLNNTNFLRGRHHYYQLNQYERFKVRDVSVGERPSIPVTEEMAQKVRMLPIVPIDIMKRFCKAEIDWSVLRKIDVAFAGNVDYEVSDTNFWDGNYETALAAEVKEFQTIIDSHRREALRQIIEMKHLRIFLGANRAIPPEMYFEMLLRSAISVSPWGLGEYCYRDYEAILAGSILIKPSSDHIRSFSPDIYQSNKYYFSCSPDFSDLPDVIASVLRNRSHSLEVAKAARDAALSENTPDKIFHYFLGLFREALEGKGTHPTEADHAVALPEAHAADAGMRGE